MPSPDAVDKADAGGPKPKRSGPTLRLIKPPNRPQELTPLEREFLPPLLEIQETPPSPVHRGVLWTIITLVIALIIWASFGQVAIVATAPGKFIPDGRVKEVQPLESSIVRTIHVKEGQHVHAGDLLLELDPTISGAELAANTDKYHFNQLEQARLTAELGNRRATYADPSRSSARIALEERMREARGAAQASKLAQARAAVEEKRSALAAAQAALQKYQEMTAIAEERESNARPLVDTGAISREDYLKLKEDLAQNRNDRAAEEKTVEQSQAALTESEHALEQVERDRIVDVYHDLDQRVTDEPQLKGDLDKARELYELKWLKAPVDGLVQKIDVTTVGQIVTPAQSLITIVPDGTPLIVEATVTNEDIGYVRPGQAVEVKVDTFPFQKYGTLKGSLVWVSPDAEEKGAASKDTDTRAGTASMSAQAKEDAANTPNAGYVYKIHIRTDQPRFRVAGEWRPAQSGMTVQADITTDRRRVIEFFLSPVVKYLDEGLKVR
jgi:hemolysin D